MADTLITGKPLPVGGLNTRSSPGWWGVWTLIVTEGSLFGYLLLSYFYYFFQTQAYWPPEGKPSLLMPGINTVILLSSSVFVHLCERLVKHQKKRGAIAMMLIGIALGVTFVTIQLREYAKKPYGISDNLYGSLYFTITGFHLAHVIVGLVILTMLLIWTWRGYFGRRRHMALTIGGLYWHFVDAVWLVIFSSLYLVPYVLEK